MSVILGNGQETEKKDSQLTLKLENEFESENNEIAKMIQALADKLVQNKKAEWRKIQLKDGRKGFGLFFPVQYWELVNDEIVEIKLT